MRASSYVILILCCLFPMQSFLCQASHPTEQVNNCRDAPQPKGRIILEEAAAGHLKVLKHESPHMPPGDLRELPVKIALEVLVNEKGEVECCHITNSSTALSSPARKEWLSAAVKAVSKWQFAPPVDSSGRSVACYQGVKITFSANDA
jgi:hypothetical protein